MSLRPLNRQIAKSHLSVRQGLFLCHYMTNFELGGFSIGYVIATSEPADSQVSSFSPASVGCPKVTGGQPIEKQSFKL